MPYRLLFGPLIALSLALTLSGCAPLKPKVDVEQAPGFTDGAYGSWNFVSPLAIEEAGYPEAMVEQFQAVIEETMTRQGFTRETEPELLVNVAAAISGEGDKSLNSDAVQAIHVQRGTFHNSWRGYGEGYGAQTRQGRYGDGSISIGIIDRDSLELVWESVATGRLSGNRSEAEMSELIDSVTRQMLEPLPRGS